MQYDIKSLVYDDPKKLSKCVIEICGNCNFKCDHCYICSKSQMTFEMFKKAIDELYELECLFVLITGGECLLHPDFKKMFLYAKNKGFLVGINTNGYYLNKDIVDFFSNNKPYLIEISLYGYDKDSYEKFTHVSDAFVIVNSNVDYAKKKGLTINFKTPLTKRNYLYLSELKKYAESKNVLYRYDYIIFPKLDSSNSCDERLSINDVVNIIKNDKLSIKHFVDKYNMYKQYSLNNDYVFQCTAGEDAIYIDSDCYINMCIVVSNKRYNLKNCLIKDAIKSFIEFKKSKFTKDELCYKCPKKALCRYCPGRFYLETGDYKKPSKWYCGFADLMCDLFNNNCFDIEKNSLELTNYELNKMYFILINNLKKIFNNFTENSNDAEIWKNSIKNNNYKFVLIYDKGEIVAYLEYYQKDNIYYLSDIEIADSHKGDGKTFKSLMTAFYKNIDCDSNIHCHINADNKKSLDVFNHIGLIKISNKEYQIIYDNLKKYIDGTNC